MCGQKLADETKDFVDRVARLQKDSPLPLVLLTHIPLHKPKGHCVDEPLTEYSGYLLGSPFFWFLKEKKKKNNSHAVVF